MLRNPQSWDLRVPRTEDSFLRTQLQMLAPAFAGEGLFSQRAIDHHNNAPVTDGAINHARRKSPRDPRPLSHLHHSRQLHSEPTVPLNSIAALFCFFFTPFQHLSFSEIPLNKRFCCFHLNSSCSPLPPPNCIHLNGSLEGRRAA